MDFISIATEEKFVKCRLCNHRVGSENPVCSNCGLETSREGVIELANLNNKNDSAIAEIQKHQDSASLLIVGSSFWGCWVYWIFDAAAWFYVPFGFCVLVSFMGISGLYQKHLQTEISSDDKLEFEALRRQSVLKFALSTLIGLAIFIVARFLKSLF
jgi:hypothetical protein